MRDDFEKQIDLLKKQHELSVKRLNNELEKLHGEKQALLSELEHKQHQQFNVNTNSRTDKNNILYSYRPNNMASNHGSYTNGGGKII